MVFAGGHANYTKLGNIKECTAMPQRSNTKDIEPLRFTGLLGAYSA